MRTWSVVLMTAVVAGVAMLVLAAVPELGFTLHDPELRVAVRTAEGGIALLAGYLVLGRARQTWRRDDLLLCGGLAVLGVSTFAFSVLPRVLASADAEAFGWSGVVWRLAGSALVAAAALLPRRTLRPGAAVRIAGATIAALVLAEVAALTAAQQVPIAGSASGDGASGGDTLLAVIRGLDSALMLAAACGLALRAERRGDRLIAGLAPAFVLGAAARFNYAMVPSGSEGFIAAADVFRIAFYLLVLVAAVREIEERSRTAMRAGALDERRRIARDLHDGLAQELASVLRNLRWLDERDASVQRAEAGARRALAAARGAIGVLGDPRDEPLAEALEAALLAVGRREGVTLDLDLSPSARAEPVERDALIHIAAEAITNAARHGHARNVRVELRGEPEVRMRIEDAGSGFDPAEAPQRTPAGGFGLTAMRERAAQIGGRLRIDSRPGAGTLVEVAL